jgi:hypothetical protein
VDFSELMMMINDCGYKVTANVNFQIVLTGRCFIMGESGGRLAESNDSNNIELPPRTL